METRLILKTFESIKNIVPTDRFQNILTIAYINATSTKSSLENLLQVEIRDVNAYLMILIQNGNAKINLDYNSYQLGTDKLAFIIPNRIFQICEISNDFKAEFLIIDKLFLEEIMQEKKGFYNYISLKKNPITHLKAKENSNLEKALLLLQEKIGLRSHVFQKEIVYNTTAGLLLELLNILIKQNHDLIHPILSRKEEIVDKFLKLLSKYTRERYPLTFYAEKLFITPQYLSATLKEQTGKTAGKWLNEALIIEAKRLIKLPHSSIQEVAYSLNFSDQSTFGKFFKKSLGISPLVYRRM